MKNKILFITPFLPVSNSGDSFVAESVLSGLKKINCSVTIICFTEEKKINKKDLLIKKWEYPGFSLIKKFLLIFSFKPLFVKKFFDKDLLNKINLELRKNNYDKIIIHSYAMAHYVDYLDTNLPIVYLEDEDMKKIFFSRFNNEERLFKKIFLYFEFLKANFYQKKYFKKFSSFWLLNSDNKESYFSKSKNKKIIPFLVNFKKNSFSLRSKDIVFVGTLSWPENKIGLVWFLKDIWPNVIEKNKKTVLHLVGKEADKELTDLVANSNNVVLHGFVNDLYDVFKLSALAISPILTNAGIKIKVLSYLQYGLPVVATKASVKGLVSNGGILTTNNQNFISKINKLLLDKTTRKKLSIEAINNIKHNYSEKTLIKFLNNNL